MSNNNPNIEKPALLCDHWTTFANDLLKSHLKTWNLVEKGFPTHLALIVNIYLFVERVLQAPGGNASNIFGNTNGVNGNGVNESDSHSIDGSLSLPSTPINGTNGSTNGHFGFDSECSTPTSSASSSRRGSRQEDTKNRLFGQELESPRRRVVDRMKSNIFSEQDGGGSIVRSASVKKYDYGMYAFDLLLR